MPMAKKKIYELDAHSSINDSDVLAISATASGNAEKVTASEIKTYTKTGLTTADVAASADKNYVTDAEKVVLGNTSGTNTGDQDLSGYEVISNKKTSLTDNSDTYYPSQKAVKTAVDAKQDTLVSGTNIKTINGASVLGSGDLTVSGTGDVVGPASSTADHIPQFSNTTGKVLKDGLGVVTSVGSPGADTNIPTEKAVRAAIAGAGGGDVSGPATNTDGYIPQRDGANSKTLKNGIPTSTFQTALGYTAENTANKKTTLAENSDTYYPSQKAVKTAVDGKMTNPMTTAGDIIYGGTDGVATRLAKGTAGQVLKMNTGATAPEWGDSSGGGTSLRTAITGTRASNTTITVATDLTAIFKKGMIVRRKESGVDKVGMVSIPSTYSSPNTTITIIGDTCASIDTGTFKYSSIIGAEQFIKNFAIAGTIGATGTDVANAYYANEPYRVIGAEINAGVVGSNSGNTVVDINKGGTTMFTTKPTLAYNALTTATPFTADSATSLALNDRVTIDIDGVCTTTFHQDLYIKLYLLPTRYLSLS